MKRALFVILAIMLVLSGCRGAKDDDRNTGETPTGIDGPVGAEYIYVEGELYLAAYQFVNSDEIQEEIVKLGEIVKRDDNHYPDEEFEADNVAVGTGVYRIGDDIYISSDGKHFQLYLKPSEYNDRLLSETDSSTIEDDTTETTSQKTENPDEESGVYYDPIDKDTISDEYSIYDDIFISCLLYNGRIYTLVSSTEDAGNYYGRKQDKQLGKAYVNHERYFSDQKELLNECDSEGLIYSLKGYDEKFRVMVEYDQVLPDSDETVTKIAIFDSVNDITLEKGSNLFYDRLLFDKNTPEVYRCVSDSEDEAGDDDGDMYLGSGESYREELLNEVDANMLVTMISDMSFTKDMAENAGSVSDRYIIRDDCGLEIGVEVYDSGAVVLHYEDAQTFYLIDLETGEKTTEAGVTP